MRVPFLLWSMPLAAAGGFAVARLGSPEGGTSVRPAEAGGRPAAGAAGPDAATRSPFSATGSKAVPEVFALVAGATPADLRRMAQALLADPRRRRDQGLWGPVLARWSETDGAGLIAFVQRDVPPGERPWLESKSWYAWGAAHPKAAAAAGKALPAPLARELIAGMAQKDAAAAASFALRMPDAQSNLYGIAAEVAGSSPDLVASLLPRAVYDGMRQPLERARASALVTSNPAGALALARHAGNIGRDPVPGTLRHIAQHDPLKAAELVEKMPSSRSRALSSLALARTWAASDSGAATEWARRRLTGPVKQGALLEIAAASGGPDPLAALGLVEEAGWALHSNFHTITDGGGVTPGEAGERLTPEKTAGLLLQQLAQLSPGAAQGFLHERVPESLRAAVAKHAGMEGAP